MNKTILRDQLFAKYFENKYGIPAYDLVLTFSYIPETWKKLHQICENNIDYFDSFSNIKQCRIININNNPYLILKYEIINYIIIDLKNNQNISKQSISKLYNIDTFANPKLLIDFYFQNQKILNLPTTIKYQISLNNAWTYFLINFANAYARLIFQTSDQFLYDQLYLNYDLTPSNMQDAQTKIGIEKMNEIFTKIKTINIPKEVIPSDLYQQYNIQKKLLKKEHL